MDEDEGEGEQGRGQDGAGRRHRGRVVEGAGKDQLNLNLIERIYL